MRIKDRWNKSNNQNLLLNLSFAPTTRALVSPPLPKLTWQWQGKEQPWCVCRMKSTKALMPMWHWDSMVELTSRVPTEEYTCQHLWCCLCKSCCCWTPTLMRQRRHWGLVSSTGTRVIMTSPKAFLFPAFSSAQFSAEAIWFKSFLLLDPN